MKKSNKHDQRFFCALISMAWLLIVSAITVAEVSYSPTVERDFPEKVYWGDPHLHTSLSPDAYALGNKLFDLSKAYQFSQGATVVAHNGMKTRLQRPLDFVVIADHAEMLGVLSGLEQAKPIAPTDAISKPTGERLLELLANPKLSGLPDNEQRRLLGDSNSEAYAEHFKRYREIIDIIHQEKPRIEEPFRRAVWQFVTEQADKHYQPGVFTTFIGYEWTSSPVGRVVIFKDGANKANAVLPFSANDSKNVEDLWQYFDDYEKNTGGEIIAIPHNSNLSLGKAFLPTDFEGNSIDRSYAQASKRWEPLYEVPQTKGDTETHPLLSPNDEFAHYGGYNPWGTGEKKEQVQYEYLRSGLKIGLQEQALIGDNPFKFGMVGGSDSHTGLSALEENNFWSVAPFVEPGPGRIDSFRLGHEQMNASGYTAVWAKDNTREAIFSAMKRKEVYASTGPRISLRFFGGWDYKPDDAFKPDIAGIGYGKGVPMGGDLYRTEKGKSPRFLIYAVKDALGANLDRVQVIKGWYNDQGQLHEKIYNVALSDNREVKNGSATPVGSTVNVKEATYLNTIGDPELRVVWQDPDFNPNNPAFYYLRVLEIPTPRWTAYDVKFFGQKNTPKDIPMVIQERAYTSPIWYNP